MNATEKAELLQQLDAHRAQAPTLTRYERDGWEVTLAHHVHTGGHWSASVLRAGEPCGAAYSLYVGDSEACARTWIETFFEPVDLGSLDPLDVGFDLRVTGTITAVPSKRANVTVRLARSKKYPEGKVLQGHSSHLVSLLRQHGYAAHTAAIAEAELMAGEDRPEGQP